MSKINIRRKLFYYNYIENKILLIKCFNFYIEKIKFMILKFKLEQAHIVLM